MTSTAAARVIDELAGALPDGMVITEQATVDNYRHDWARDPHAGVPAAVVRPTHADHVQTTMRWANKYQVPVVPRGAGTGLSGGSSAVDGGITLSLDRMRDIQIDTSTRVAIVEPGALNAEVKAAAAEHSLWYPPDPSSFEICSIGGNIATNAGGLCCVKYGVTTDYVLGLDVVLADGTKIVLGGPRIKDVAGLSLLKLFVGSEGTLGVVTRAILRLVPEQPPKSTIVGTFPTIDASANAVVAIGRTLRPAMMELMDRTAVNAVEDFQLRGLDRTAGAMLLAQSDAPGEAGAHEVEVMDQAFRDAGAIETFLTHDPDEAEMFVAARRAVFPALDERGTVMHEDVGVPVPELPKLLLGIQEIAAKHSVEVPVVAHAGDGNTHPNVVYDASDPASVQRAAEAFDEIMDLAISLGGTITGEHGVGRLKRHMLGSQVGPDVLALTHKVKAALDPLGILNPGAILATDQR